MVSFAKGYNPLRWDCEKRGCFNIKRRPKIEVFHKCFPGNINFGDVDGIVEINGRGLMLEWKSGKPNKKGELVIYPEHIYQVSMYWVGYEIQFKKKIKRAIVAMFDKTSINYAIRGVERDEIQEAFENVCIPVIKIYNSQKRKKGRVVK